MEILEGTKVLLLSDEPKDTPEMQRAIQMSAALISAAREDRLASIVCTDKDGYYAVVLCAMFPDENGNTASYVPIARQFDPHYNAWTEMHPPKCALPVAA